MQTREQASALSSENAAGAAASPRFYRPELDVLRFGVFVMVYLGHTLYPGPETPSWLAAWFNANTIGVPIFFALSAFLFTELLTIEKRTTGKVHLRPFYLRRILRIWPLYFLVLFAGFFFSRLRGTGASFPVSALLAYLFLVGDWYTSIHDYLPAGLIALWTIPVEEQFYTVWPLCVRGMTRRTLGILCLVAWFFSQAVVVLLCLWHVSADPGVWTNTFAHLQYFALGVGLSLTLDGRVPSLRGSLRLLMIAGALGWLVVVERVFNPRSHYGLASIGETFPELLLAGFSVLIILTAFLGWNACRRFKRMQYLGKISYGLYVYHIPCLLLLGKVSVRLMGRNNPLWVDVIAFPMTVGLAVLSYRYFERPFLRIKERFAFVKSRPV
ncbi:MAG: acyltransferase [Terracidiphilus sp.]